MDVKGDHIKSFHLVKAAIVNRKKTIDKKKVERLKMRWLRFDRSHPFQIKYRETHNDLEAWKIFDVERRTKGRPPDLGRIELPLLRKGLRGIDQKKMTDLLGLLDFIPPIRHDYYKKPKVSGSDEAEDSEELESDIAYNND